MSDYGSEDEEERSAGISLAGFLFGNIDIKTGKLENQSLFGDNSEKHLRQLENLGLGIDTVLSDEEPGSEEGEVQLTTSNGINVSEIAKTPKTSRQALSSYEDSSSENESDNDNEEVTDIPGLSNNQSSKSRSVEDDYDDLKSHDAVDYSDISECIEDDEIYYSSANDKQIMPPPTNLPKTGWNSRQRPILNYIPTPAGKKLDTPLASILPSKYAGISVTTLFPDFRADKVLRFSKLFGPGKFHNLPHIWKNVKKRRRRKMETLQQKDKIVDASSKSETSPVSDKPSTLHSPDELDKVQWGKQYEADDELEEFDDENPDPSWCASDQEDLFCRSHSESDDDDKKSSIDDNNLGNASAAERKHLWRHGPASIWFEMLGVPENPEHFDYGFKKKSSEKLTDSEDNDSAEEGKKQNKADKFYPDDSFNMVTQSDWEESIIWDSQDPKTKSQTKNKTAGWVPSGSNRSVQTVGTGKSQDSPSTSTQSASKTSTSAQSPAISTKSSRRAKEIEDVHQADDTWYSIFPVETTELVNGHWEKDIIWDVDNVEQIPEPKVLELDPNDENIILCIPDDVDPNASRNTAAPVKVKIPLPHVKKSKILLGKAGVINVIEEDSPPPSPKHDDKDPYNLSLDEYYQAKFTEQAVIKISTTGNLLQHSTPVVELRSPFIPTHINAAKLRGFHRPLLRRLGNGSVAHPGPHTLISLTRHNQRMAKEREEQRQATGGGDIFFMRTAEDFTGKDGELFLVEYCEEFPPLLGQVGMCSKLKHYYKRIPGKDDGPGDQPFGETVIAHTSPFLGAMHPGQMITTLENNMYRSAIFTHPLPPTDFIIIRTRNFFFIRPYDRLFTAAQECPLFEVPGPNSKRSNNFVRDFLQVFIYRLFWSSRDTPRRIRMDDIKKAFPTHSESSIRKRLKQCADFKRTGADSNWWVLKPEFRLPMEEEIRAMVSPEQCCAHFSLASAEQRLLDAGYGTQSILAPPEDEDETGEKKVDDEVKVAPWNTTRAYIHAVKGKCILQITGPADPTGCGEGFSYIRMPNKPQNSIEEKETQPKRIVTGTDADLRKLSLNNAKALLRKFGVPEEEIQKLSRWEVIDVVRTLSTEKAKAGEEGMNKFSRGNRFSVAEHQERYKEECQRIFELQNRVLHSSELLSTDEGESTEEDDNEDIEEMGKNIEDILTNNKTTSQLSHEREEAERKELQKMLMGDDDKNSQKNKRDLEEDNRTLNGLTMHPGRVLKIQRTYKSNEGKEFVRHEIVRNSNIVDIYLRIRTTKDDNFIKQFALINTQTKEEMKREKRKIQEKLRRMKRNQERDKDREFFVKPPRMPRKRKIKIKPELKVKCGACGQVGHMRTNKACPYFEQNNETVPSINVAMTEEEEVAIKLQLIDDSEELIKVDGTKVQLSAKLVKHAAEIKRRSLLLKVPREAIKRKRSTAADLHCDYLEGKSKGANRMRTDPQVVLSNMMENIINELLKFPNSSHFHFPVGPKVPRYYDVVANPMDLQTMRERNRRKSYRTRLEFRRDLKLLEENSRLYNGDTHQVTGYARDLVEVAESFMARNEEQMWGLEKQINPLLDDNEDVRFNYILKLTLERIKKLQDSHLFLKPVNKKLVTDYYDIVKNPIDLGTIQQRISGGRYKSHAAFMSDMDLLYDNARTFNGPDHSVTKRARALVDAARTFLDEAMALGAEDSPGISIDDEMSNSGMYYEDDHNSAEKQPTDYVPEEKRFRREPSSPDRFLDVEDEDLMESGIYKRSLSNSDFD